MSGIATQQGAWDFDTPEGRRRCRVMLPESYHQPASSERRYPVLYLLDGHFLGGLIQGVLGYMSTARQAPEMILVAVESEDRIKDFTPTHSLVDAKGIQHDNFKQSGGAATLLHFLTDQLIPAVEEHYRTTSERTLAGYSLSGLFSLYALLQAPTLFAQTMAVDPSLWWDQGHVLSCVGEAIQDGESTQRVYLCASHTPEYKASRLPENARAFYEQLETRSDRFTARYEHFEDETHSTISPVGFYRGLRFLFAGRESE